MLDHVDAQQLRRVKGLLRPGGMLAVLGLARSTPRDLPWDAIGTVQARIGHRVLLALAVLRGECAT
jgi:hypothetical protein